MRLASLAIAATMLLTVGPAVADQTISGSITVEDDVYVKPGWWKGSDDGTGGVAAQEDGSHENKEKLAWLWITPKVSNPTSSVNIDVETNRSVVAAMDIFKVRDDGDMTPDCPQELVEDLYPEENENAIFWLDRIERQTTQHHQRGIGPVGMSVDLYPSESPRGWLVAVYPQAGSGHDQVEAATGEQAEIQYEVTINEDEMEVNKGLTYKQPERPFDLQEWGLLNAPGATVDCAEKGVGLPDAVSDIDEAEIPGPGPAEERVTSLLDTHLE